MNKKSIAVVEWRRRTKVKAVDLKGGQCIHCGYKKNYAALEFHHLDPEQKMFAISLKGVPRAWDKIEQELKSCVLICSNCHAEHHDENPTRKNDGVYSTYKECSVHGYTEARMVSRGDKRNPTLHCVKCERERFRRNRRKIKEFIVSSLGGECSVCSYQKSFLALDAHHTGEKKYAVAKMTCKKKISEELRSCILLCRNCHQEEHHPHLKIPE